MIYPSFYRIDLRFWRLYGILSRYRYSAYDRLMDSGMPFTEEKRRIIEIRQRFIIYSIKLEGIFMRTSAREKKQIDRLM